MGKGGLKGRRRISAKTNQENMENYYSHDYDEDWAYVGIFYSMVTSSVLNVLEQEMLGKESGFAEALSTSMKKVITELKDKFNDIKFMHNCRDSTVRVTRGLTFTERVISLKIRGGENYDVKVKSFKSTLATLENMLKNIDAVGFKNLLASTILHYNTNAYATNLVFQILLDAIGQDSFNGWIERFLFQEVQLGLNKIFDKGDNPFADEKWAVCKMATVAEVEKRIRNDGIFGRVKTWFGDISVAAEDAAKDAAAAATAKDAAAAEASGDAAAVEAVAEKRKKIQEKKLKASRKDSKRECKAFNERVVARFSEYGVIERLCEVVNVKILYSASPLDLTNETPDNTEKIKRILVENELDENMPSVLMGYVNFEELSTEHVSPLSFYKKNMFGKVHAELRSGLCTGYRFVEDEIWNLMYINGSTLKVVPCSILSKLPPLTPDLRNKLPPAYSVIDDIVSEMYARKTKSESLDVDIMVEKARLLKFIKTGRISGHFSTIFMEKLISKLHEKEALIETEKDAAKLVKVDKKEGETEIAYNERCFRKTWTTYFAVKVEDKKTSEKKGPKRFTIKALETPVGGLSLEDLECYVEEVSPETMCPYFSLPVAVKVKDPRLNTGVKILREIGHVKKPSSEPKKKSRDAPKKVKPDPQTGELVVKDNDGNVTVFDQTQKESEESEVEKPKTEVVVATESGTAKNDDESDRALCAGEAVMCNVMLTANARKEVKTGGDIPKNVQVELDKIKAGKPDLVKTIDALKTWKAAIGYLRGRRDAFTTCGVQAGTITALGKEYDRHVRLFKNSA